MRRCLLPVLLLCLSRVHAADAWHTNLLVPGLDVWHGRIPVDLTNTSDGDVAGRPVPLRIGAHADMLDIAGHNARAVRVCDAAGTEMLLDLRDADGVRVEDGPIREGSILTVPATAPAKGVQRLYVYFDNPEAYLLPEYLSGHSGVANPGFESGVRTTPDEWRFANADEQHTMAWVKERPHGGERCVTMAAEEGAEARWMTIHQPGLPVTPGARYRITAWARGEGVVGQAGWYVHVATPDDPLALNRVESAGDGTFDWRQVSIEFTAPEDATAISHGTVLYGTGTAWYDDAKLERLDAPEPQVTAKIGPVERLDLARIEGDGTYLTADGQTWECRAPIYVVNVGEAMTQAVVRTPGARLKARLQRGFNPRSLRLVDPVTKRVLPQLMLDGHLLFLADVPARSIKTFHAYISRDRDLGPGPGVAYDEFIASPANLARNPSFEQGDRLPADWLPMGEGEEAPTARMERVSEGRLGEHCGRLTVAPDAPERWTGWRQDVAVEPGSQYLFMAYARTEGITDGKVRLHAHLFDAPDADTGQTIWSGGPDLVGDSAWQLLGGVIRTRPTTTRLVMFLTMNARGTVYHDGVVLMRTMPGDPGALEHRTAPGDPPLRVWVENPIVKAFRDTPPEPTPERIELAAARGEEECLQLCLRASEDTRGMTVEVDPPQRDGARLPRPRVEQVGFVPCLEVSGFFRSDAPAWERRKPNGPERSDGWRGWWPDYLTPLTGQADLQADRTQPLWITFAIPRDAAPGQYQSTVRVRPPAGEPIAIPLTLQVWRFQLPERPTLQALFDLRNGPGWNLYDTAERREQWWRFMAHRRISSDRVLPEPVFRLADGEVTMDATEFDRAAELYFGELHMSAAYFPWSVYSFGWGHSPRDFLGLTYNTPEYQKAYKQAVRLFWDHVKERGWADRFSLYVSDEPHYHQPDVLESLPNVIRLTREVDPAIPVYSSTWGHVPEWDGILNHWGIAQYGRFPLDTLKERLAAGDKIWITVDGQLVLDTPYNACERLLPYYCFAHNISGYEFWALPWYTYDPLRFGWYSYLFHSFGPDDTTYTRYPNGSGHLAYPGELIGLDGPLSTVRLEQVREGLEDYEVLAALRRLADEKPDLRAQIEPVLAEARALAPIPNAGGFRSTEILPDPDALLRVRLRAGELLDRLMSR